MVDFEDFTYFSVDDMVCRYHLCTAFVILFAQAGPAFSKFSPFLVDGPIFLQFVLAEYIFQVSVTTESKDGFLSEQGCNLLVD